MAYSSYKCVPERNNNILFTEKWEGESISKMSSFAESKLYLLSSNKDIHTIKYTFSCSGQLSQRYVTLCAPGGNKLHTCLHILSEYDINSFSYMVKCVSDKFSCKICAIIIHIRTHTSQM
jgi:hypothetical protein